VRPDGSLERKAENWSPGARHCLSCHREQGASSHVPEAWGHPQKYMTLAGQTRPDGRTMPLFDAEGRTDGAIGRVDCTSCHNPHVAHPEGGGEHSPDFLRQETSEAVCADCHGDKALWKYRYYHSSEKRVLP
jgi:predicted CXXCH cytochrome family protein